ncbi:MAG: M23 family metallopeptidase [Actinomycetota bacterium]
MAAFIVPLLLVAVLPPRAAAEQRFGWPLKGRIIRGFEPPRGHYGEGGHQGVDIAGGAGAQVKAAGEGTVAWVGELPTGRFVSVSHAGGVRTIYLDLGSISVAAGQEVSRGQVLGTLGGGRDPSSSRTHLHFDVYLNGVAVDPRLVMGDDRASFIRLCPVSGTGDPRAPSPVNGGPGLMEPSGGPSLLRRLTAPVTGVLGTVRDGLGTAWAGACDLWSSATGAFDRWWDHSAYPFLCDVGRGFADTFHSVWSNRYVQATVAGLLAAVVVVGVVLIVAFTLPISATVAAVAAVAGGLACLVVAIVYAVMHPEGFRFVDCFWRSLAGGGAVATLVVSAGGLSAIVSTGWAEAGLLGTLKAAFTSGLFSAAFEGTTGYLFTGHLSVKQVLVAFAMGFVSGGVFKVVNDGLTAGRFIETLRVAFEASHLKVMAIFESGCAMLRISSETVRGVLIVIEDIGLRVGEKVAYLAFSGSFGSTLHIASCLVNNKPITYTGILASFVSGAAMGAFTLYLGGFKGLMGRFEMFNEGLGRVFKNLASRVLTKALKKGIDKGVNVTFRRIFNEKEALK